MSVKCKMKSLQVVTTTDAEVLHLDLFFGHAPGEEKLNDLPDHQKFPHSMPQDLFLHWSIIP